MNFNYARPSSSCNLCFFFWRAKALPRVLYRLMDDPLSWRRSLSQIERERAREFCGRREIHRNYSSPAMGWASRRADLETVRRRQETQSLWTRQDLWSGRGTDTAQAKGIFLLFFATSEVQIGSHLFFAIFEIDLGSSDDGDGDWGLARAIVKRVINEFLKGSLGILENFNWNMLLRKSVQNCH